MIAGRAEVERAAGYLERGADYISENGLFKGALHPHSTGSFSMGMPVCAIGGIREAAGRLKSRQSLKVDYAVGFADIALMCEVGGSVPYWNDREETTLDDVVEAMRQAAKGLRNSAGELGE